MRRVRFVRHQYHAAYLMRGCLSHRETAETTQPDEETGWGWLLILARLGGVAQLVRAAES